MKNKWKPLFYKEIIQSFFQKINKRYIFPYNIKRKKYEVFSDLCNLLEDQLSPHEFNFVYYLKNINICGHFRTYVMINVGFPGGSAGKEPACQCGSHRRHGFDP